MVILMILMMIMILTLYLWWSFYIMSYFIQVAGTVLSSASWRNISNSVVGKCHCVLCSVMCRSYSFDYTSLFFKVFNSHYLFYIRLKRRMCNITYRYIPFYQSLSFSNYFWNSFNHNRIIINYIRIYFYPGRMWESSSHLSIKVQR